MATRRAKSSRLARQDEAAVAGDNLDVPQEEKITLECVQVRGKLRIRFHSYTNAEGKAYGNVYNNNYNCQFPRDIRRPGRFYEIGPDDLVLVHGGGKTPFYRVKTHNIRILSGGPQSEVVDDDSDRITPVAVRTPAVTRPAQIFEVNECVICLEGSPQEIFIPCAHLCACSSCYAQMKAHKPICPLCRRAVINSIKNQ